MSDLHNPKVNYLNLKYLDETPILDDQHYGLEAQLLLERLNSIDWSFLFWLIGSFGTGKSTMLNEMKILVSDDAKWLHFDARQFPDRKELRDGFVIEFTKQLISKEFPEIVSQINWERSKSGKFIDMTINGLTAAASAVIGMKHPGMIAEVPIIHSVLSSIINDFQKPQKAINRIYEYQNILKNLLDCFKSQTIYVVLEDIDRSGDSWIHFLETLNNFIRGSCEDIKLICICPIDNKSLEENFQKYLKVLNYYDFFNPTIEPKKIVDNMLLSDYHEIASKSLIQIVKRMLKVSPTHTMREIKFIFRVIYSKYLSSSENLDWYLYLLTQLLIIWKRYHRFSTEAEQNMYQSKWIQKLDIWIWHAYHNWNSDLQDYIITTIIEHCQVQMAKDQTQTSLSTEKTTSIQFIGEWPLAYAAPTTLIPWIYIS